MRLFVCLDNNSPVDSSTQYSPIVQYQTCANNGQFNHKFNMGKLRLIILFFE